MKQILIKIGIIIIIVGIIYYLSTNKKTNDIEPFKSTNSSLKNKVNSNTQQIEELNKKLINAQTQLTQIENKQKKMDNMVKKGEKMGNKIKNRK